MKKILPVISVCLAGLITLFSLIFRPQSESIIEIILHWGIILTSMATLVGITNLMITHFRRVAEGKKGFFFSLIVLFGFLVSLIGGLFLGVDNPGYLIWVASIRLPLEVSLMGVLALTLTYTVIQFFRRKNWTPMSIAFGTSAMIFLILQMGFIQALDNPVIDQIVEFIENLPIAGGRGILIGISLGALLTGLRVIFGAERPYGEK